MHYRIVSSVLILIFTTGAADASEVRKVCAPGGLTVLDLDFRNREGNLKKIRAANLGSKGTAKEIVEYYKDAKRKFNPETDAAVARKINQNSVPDFDLKERLLKYALRKDRLADPSDYNDLVLDALQAFSPRVDEGLLALMSTKSSAVRSFFFGLVFPGASLSEVEGAVTRIENVRDGKSDSEKHLGPLEMVAMPKAQLGHFVSSEKVMEDVKAGIALTVESASSGEVTSITWRSTGQYRAVTGQ